MNESFVRRVVHTPKMYLPRTQREAPFARGFVRRLDVRPGRFIVNNPSTKLPDWKVPKKFLEVDAPVVGPLFPALYLGRVEDIDEDSGSVEVEVWEVPNGREGTTTLTHEDFRGQAVEVGDTLEIYTWLEIPLGPKNEPPKVVPRIHVEVTEPPPLTNEERQLLAALADTLEST